MKESQRDVDWSRWGGVATIALLLLGLTVFSYWSVDRTQRDIETLSTSELPLFNDILDLRTALVDAESAVYEFYLTADDERFRERFDFQAERIESYLDKFTVTFGDQVHVSTLAETHQQIKKEVIAFNAVMSEPWIDWSAAREVLVRYRPLTEQASEQSQALAQWVEQRIIDKSRAYSSRVQQTLYLITFLVLFSVFAVSWMAWTNYSRLRALAEQKRLASFPKSNPYPVLSLDEQGRIRYANDAAYGVAGGGDFERFLPDEIKQYLTRSEQYHEWEYEKGGRFFRINLGFLPKHREYHVYVTDISARKRAEQGLEYLAYHDATTGLVNRQHFNAYVEQHLMQPNSAELYVAIMDLDLLSKVLSVAGVSIAEKVARISAQRLQSSIAGEATGIENGLSYIGGGMFCFACPCEKDKASQMFERMQQSIAHPFDVDGFEFYLRLTIGTVSREHIEGCSCENALRLADSALQIAKQKGVGHAEFYERGIEEKYQHRLAVEYGLRNAIELDQLSLYYQPKVCLKTGRVMGVEALVRWAHPQLGQVSPAEFIPIAEASGQIIEIGQWVLEQSIEDAAVWNQGRSEPVTVAINISANQLLYSDVGVTALTAARRNDVPIAWIEMEITETAALSDFDRALDRLNQLNRLGVRLSLDDFGTGFSSLSYLQQLPVYTLKIDRSFIRPLNTGGKEEALTESIIKMAHQLDLNVVAEGVETEGQFGMLREWGCNYVQGYFFAKPMPLDALLNFLNEHDKARYIQAAARG